MFEHVPSVHRQECVRSKVYQKEGLQFECLHHFILDSSMCFVEVSLAMGNIKKVDTPASSSNLESGREKPVSRHVMPLGPRVLVRLIKSSDRTVTGLFLPPGSKDDLAVAAYGQVIEVARADQSDDGFGTNVSGVPEGSNVLFDKSAGLPVPWDEDLRILNTKDVVAVVEEIDLEGAH